MTGFGSATGGVGSEMPSRPWMDWARTLEPIRRMKTRPAMRRTSTPCQTGYAQGLGTSRSSFGDAAERAWSRQLFPLCSHVVVGDEPPFLETTQQAGSILD